MQSICLFTVPNENLRRNAIGSLAGVPIKIKKPLNVIIPLFDPIPAPSPDDWLWNNDEDGQTFDQFKSIPKNYIDEKRKVIYIQPLEKGIDETFLANLKTFVENYYFGVKIAIRKPIIITEYKQVPILENPETNMNHISANEVINVLKNKLPSDAYCMLGVCMTDLYHREQSNWVFGLATLKDRVGVFSFARYNASFFYEDAKDDNFDSMFFYRCCKVMIHEIGHMFSIKHCIFFKCIMNGSNHLRESDDRPIEMCPVCIRKLQHIIGFQFLERSQAMYKVCSEMEGEKFGESTKYYKLVSDEIQKFYNKF